MSQHHELVTFGALDRRLWANVGYSWLAIDLPQVGNLAAAMQEITWIGLRASLRLQNTIIPGIPHQGTEKLLLNRDMTMPGF